MAPTIPGIYRLLGDLEIQSDDGLLPLPTGPTLQILAFLLLYANKRLSKAELIRAAWGVDDVQEAQLHKRMMAVRAVLAAIGRREDLVTHQRFGYELRADDDEVDALRFLRLVREAREAESVGYAENEISLLREAIGLWRGAHPLSNVPGEPFPEAAELEQRHRRAAARLFELELAAGNHEPILSELIRVAGFYPANRRLTEQLMIAQYRSGELSEVARAYEHYRAALSVESGGEPDPVLRDLHFAIARGDKAATVVAEAGLSRSLGAQSARPAVIVPRQLPPMVELVGRDDLAAEAVWLLGREQRAGTPVLVISGPAGIGKTALALRAAHESAGHYPDGQLYAELRGTADGPRETSEVLAAFLRALSAPRIPETKAERLAEYRTLLASRRVLVVLDDAADGSQAGELVPANPDCAVLVTARRRLPEIPGASHLGSLEPLSPRDATVLFERIVHNAGLPLPDSEADDIQRVVALCGGLPLALCIAGALRVHDYPRPTSDLADRLALQGPEGFAYGSFNVARTIGAGFEQLNADARRLFLALGLLPLTSFGQWTAAALLQGAGADTGAALSELAATFIVEPVEAEVRYRFHDLTRAHARRLAVAEYPGDRDEVPGLAYRALLTLLRRAHFRLYGSDFDVVHSDTPAWDAPPAALAEVDADPRSWFAKEHANIRAAVTHCAELGLTGICWDLALSAHMLYTLSGLFDDWYATASTALAACRKVGERRGEALMLVCLAQPALVASRPAGDLPGLADLEQAISVLAEQEDRHGQAIALRTLGNALRRQGQLTRPLALFAQALELYEASGDTVGRWQTLRYIGQAHLNNGDYAQASPVLEQAMRMAAEIGDALLIAQTRYWIGQARLASGDLNSAQAAFDAVYHDGGEDGGNGRAYALLGMGSVALQRGDHGEAEQRFTAAAELAREGADAALEGRVLQSLAALRGAQGRQQERVETLQRAVAVLSGDTASLQARALAALADAFTDQGDTAAAETARTSANRLRHAADPPEQDRFHDRLGL